MWDSLIYIVQKSLDESNHQNQTSNISGTSEEK